MYHCVNSNGYTDLVFVSVICFFIAPMLSSTQYSLIVQYRGLNHQSLFLFLSFSLTGCLLLTFFSGKSYIFIITAFNLIKKFFLLINNYFTNQYFVPYTDQPVSIVTDFFSWGVICVCFYGRVYEWFYVMIPTCFY